MAPLVGRSHRKRIQIQASEYYPLAKGNIWKYQVSTASSAIKSTVEWRVTSADKSKDGIIYQVWPTPSDEDDEAMMLHMSSLGLEEMSFGILIPKSPIFVGEKWTSVKPTRRRFRVLSVGQPCHTGKIVSENCLTVEDEDDAVSFRTITTYAKGIGPIRYEYYRKSTKAARPIQIVELLSYHLDPL
ncbi:MAG: hypothetical protein ABSC48_10130 [Terracidiphilus sp.]